MSEQKNVVTSVLGVVLDEPSVRAPAATAGCKLAGLKAMGHILEHADTPRDIMRTHDLKTKLERLARSKTEVIVAQLTDKLMRRLNII